MVTSGICTSYASHRDLTVIGSLSCLLSFPNALQREISIYNSATSSFFLILRCSKCSFIPVQTHPVFSLHIQGVFLEGHPSRTKVVSTYFRTRPRDRAYGFYTFIPKTPLGWVSGLVWLIVFAQWKTLCPSPQSHPHQREARTEGTGIVLHGSHQRAGSQAKFNHRLWDTITSGVGSGILNLFPTESWAACSFESSKSGEKNLQNKHVHPFLQYFDTDQCPARRGHL